MLSLSWRMVATPCWLPQYLADRLSLFALQKLCLAGGNLHSIQLGRESPFFATLSCSRNEPQTAVDIASNALRLRRTCFCALPHLNRLCIYRSLSLLMSRSRPSIARLPQVRRSGGLIKEKLRRRGTCGSKECAVQLIASHG